MAFARDTYTAGAAQTDFTITFPYLAEEDVLVYDDAASRQAICFGQNTSAPSGTVDGFTMKTNVGNFDGSTQFLLYGMPTWSHTV